MFGKILVANRGEIACRVIRAAKELGVRTVAIYSDVEPTATHVKIADESFQIGSDPLDTYLNMHRIVRLAAEVGAEAIHPGYGFLAENPEFPRACEAEGIVFIGPPADVIELLGGKASAKQAMKAAGLPTVPGSDGVLEGPEQARAVASEIGYPVLLKAVAGGGGRGIRVCWNEKELIEKYPSAHDEAAKAFGSGSLLLERFIPESRHIEFQVLADSHGHCIHLGERDCSIQRRNQKLVEIAPSRILTPEARAHYGALVSKAAREIGYVNAGTMEFIADESNDLYFIEMNTRIQVEHPVTEMVTGLDIVRWQIRIAAGEPITYRQEDIRVDGCAIECRINAEDPKSGFAPSIGTVERYYVPGGFRLRVEHAASRGFEVTPHYDSLIAKLVVSSASWNTAIQRMLSALETYEITGVRTTIPLLIRIMQEEDFRAGNVTTKYLEKHPGLFEYEEYRNKEDFAALLSAAIAAWHGL